MTPKKRQTDRRNPVAKYARQLQRAATYRDRGKYRRQAKHKGHEPFPLLVVISHQRKGPGNAHAMISTC